MLLKKLEITDFLSIKGTLAADLDKKVSILLGSNDHGKSNILRAIEHLNGDRPILEDEVNWDSTTDSKIAYIFSLTEDDEKMWVAVVEKLRGEIDERVSKKDEVMEITPDSLPAELAKVKAVAQALATKSTGGSAEEDEEKSHTRLPEDLPPNLLSLIPRSFKLVRTGIDGPLSVEGVPIEDLPPSMNNYFVERIPRVELFKAVTGNLQDSATAEKIVTDDYEFFQGVFFYAGLDPHESSNIFTKNDKTHRVLQNASAKLDEALRKLWGQGTDLHFHLSHTGKEIEFLVDDPSIKSQVARMSKRSSGVTQFFNVSMILNARWNKFAAKLLYIPIRRARSLPAPSRATRSSASF